MRRLVSGYVEQDTQQHGGGTKARKGMLRLVRESGLKVQRAGKEAAKQLEVDIVEHGKQWATIPRLAHQWLAVTRRSGPARIGQLQEIGLARGRVRACMLRAHEQGCIPCLDTARHSAVWCGQDPRPALGSALQRLYVAAAQEIAEVREEAPRCTPAEAAKGWLMAARFAMWRVWAADEAASRGKTRQAHSCAFVDGLRSRLLQQAAGGKAMCATKRWRCEEGLGYRWGGCQLCRRGRSLRWGKCRACRRGRTLRGGIGGGRAVSDCWMGRRGGARRRSTSGGWQRSRGSR